MRINRIKDNDIANGFGITMSLWTQGCPHHCKGCFNEETWNFHYGKPFTEETEKQVLDYLDKSYIAGLSLLGGEPFEHVNQQGLLPLLRKVKARFPEKNIWCYTGYDFEKDILGRMAEQWEETKEMLSYIDVLVDGDFVQDQYDISLRFRGSSNQRLIDMNKTRAAGRVILWQDDPIFADHSM